MGGFDENGRPIRLPHKEGVPTQPAIGGTNWYPVSYSPHTGLYYIPASIPVDAKTPYDSALLAFNPKTIQKKWEFRMQEGAHRLPGSPCQCGTGALSTASDLVFTGGQGRYFYALDARTGRLLWKVSLAAGPVQTGAIAYSVAGQEFITVPAGNTLFAFSLPH
jgi:alcohol dehydrogenase (cytochrome c)